MLPSIIQHDGMTHTKVVCADRAYKRYRLDSNDADDDEWIIEAVNVSDQQKMWADECASIFGMSYYLMSQLIIGLTELVV